VAAIKKQNFANSPCTIQHTRTVVCFNSEKLFQHVSAATVAAI